MKGRIYAAWFGAWAALLLRFPHAAMDAARRACQLFYAGVLPALFPFLVVSLLLTAQWGRIRASANEIPLLRLPASALPILLLGLLGGSPAGARLIAAQCAQKRLTPTQAQRMAAYCATCSPLFVLGTLCSWLGSPDYGPLLLSVHIGASLLTGLFFAPLIHVLPAQNAAVQDDAPSTLGAAIWQAAQAMLTVCGCMMAFMALLAGLESLFPAWPPALGALLACCLEMASGCARLVSLRLPVSTTVPLLCAAISFGGFSIFAQNATFLRGAGVRLSVQFASRLLHAGLAWTLCRLLLPVFVG